MTTVPPTTGEVPEAGSTASTEPDEPKRPNWRYGVPGRLLVRDLPAVDAISNELASTEREWAIKPPPGMEAEPLTWRGIRRDLYGERRPTST